MSDSTLENDDDLSQTQEYFIAGTVILLFGLLYWFLNGHWSSDPLSLKDSAPVSSIRTLGPIPLANFTPDADQAGQTGADDHQAGQGTRTATPAAATQTSTTAPASTAQASVMPAQQTAAPAQVPAQATPTQAETSTTPVAQAPAQAQSLEATAPVDQPPLAEAQPTAMEPKPATQEAAAVAQAPASTRAEPKPVAGATMTEGPASPATTQPAAQVLASEYSLPDGTPVNINNGPETELRDVMANKTLDKPVTFPDLRFAQGSANLSADSEQSIKAIAALMNAHPDTKILVRGHTDGIGEATDNSRLSLMRASTLGNALVKLGIDKPRIIIMGMGDQLPLGSNDTEENRSKNRRIDVSITQ